MSDLVIVGCGGFGREVFALIEALRRTGQPWTVEGFIDDAPSSKDLERLRALKMAHLGDTQVLASRYKPYAAVIGVGSADARRSIVERLATSAVSYPTLVHPDATVGVVTLGPGTVVAAGARLSTNVKVGAHVQIDQNATVGHDSVLDDYSRLNPTSCISGSVHVEGGALVGANATVLQGLRVGSRATVGAGAVAAKDVPPGIRVKGVPAR